MAQQFDLYTYWRSSCSWRVRWALLHKGLAFQSHPVNLLKAEHRDNAYLSVNPAGVLPTLVVNGTPIQESLAILEYLEETQPQKPLLPSAPLDRAYVRRLAYTVAAGIFPIQNLSVQKHVEAHGLDRLAFARHWIEKGFTVFETILNDEGRAGSFCLGGNATLADVCLVPQVYNAHRFGVDMSLFPKIEDIYQRCLKLPACEKAAPENQPDAVK